MRVLRVTEAPQRVLFPRSRKRPPVDCQSILTANNEWRCVACNTLVPPLVHRNCPVPAVPLSPELERIIARYQCGCKGNKVSRQVFRERAEHCDTCQHRQDVTCGKADVILAVALAYKIHLCPEGLW